ncbi:helix-turn-helix transcriptional regulator [Nocardiopsis sp. HNM0947]|uniref:Helix-turn-helix transcriptional regulator n=1 Tax=Nocardiopsis coralli TaxID=2772213 RepID=A0ABR9P4W4_9ACTN|nr:helix-turn-helix transcriptional regulator [Nocardiopsis coralli]MBE2998878.1 helix-turn-helix transcriptional regulator [Nocardiopsis coralli]
MSESPPVSSPVVQYFANQVKRLRNEKGLTQDQLGKRIGYTGAMVGYVENAKRIPTEKFILGCDEQLDAGGVLNELWPLINRESYPDWFRPFVELEAEAISLRAFEVQVVPGLFQTEAYARAVLSAGWPPPKADDVERQLSARLERQKILDRDNPPLLWAVLEESVVRRPVGGRSAMAEQLKYLLEISQRPHVRVQVLPFANGVHAAMDGAFEVLEMGAREKVLYVERPGGGHIISDATEVAKCDQRMSALVGLALSPEESAELITTSIGDL